MKTMLLAAALSLISAGSAAAEVMTFTDLGGEYASRYSTYTENGLTLTILSGYAAKASIGDPTAPGVVSYGFNNVFELTAAESLFTFQGFGLFVQTNFGTNYTIAGMRGGASVFSYSGSQAGTNSRFILQPSASDLAVDRVTLTFNNSGRVQGASTIDNVSATRVQGTNPIGDPPMSAVPEPMTWGMMLVGFGAIGSALRRRRGTIATTVAVA